MCGGGVGAYEHYKTKRFAVMCTERIEGKYRIGIGL